MNNLKIKCCWVDIAYVYKWELYLNKNSVQYQETKTENSFNPPSIERYPYDFPTGRLSTSSSNLIFEIQRHSAKEAPTPNIDREVVSEVHDKQS